MSLRFAKSHEWVKEKEGIAIIGISDYAQKELGDIVFVELPKVGAKLIQSQQFGTVESTKAASELFAPLTGEIVEVNNDLINTPQLINEDAQEKGWIVKVKIENSEELKSLIDETAYKEFIEKEKH